MQHSIKSEHTYSSLRNRLLDLDKFFEQKCAEYGTHLSKRVWYEYKHYPTVPHETDMSDLEVSRLHTYLDDLQKVIYDIRDEEELEILCILFRELKMDLYVARRGNQGRSVILA